MISQELKDKNFYSWLCFFLGMGIAYQGIVYFKGFLFSSVIDVSLIEAPKKLTNPLSFLIVIPIIFLIFYLVSYMLECFFRGYILRISTAHFKSFFLGNITQSLLLVILFSLIPLILLSFVKIPNTTKLSILLKNSSILSLVYIFFSALILGKFKKEFGTIKTIMKLHVRGFYIFLFPFLISIILSTVNKKKFSPKLFDYYIYSNKTYTLIVAIITLVLGIFLIYIGDKKIQLLRELNPKNWKIKDDVVQDKEDNIIENIEDENNSSS